MKEKAIKNLFLIVYEKFIISTIENDEYFY